MRERFNLDLATLDRFTVLIHGSYNSGKTYLGGDMLRYYQGLNKKAWFINIRVANGGGEDGEKSAANLGLGDIGEHVDTLDDFKAACADATKAGVDAVFIDGGKWLYRLVEHKITGGRDPGKDDYSAIHREGERVITGLRKVAPVVLVASSSDRSVDQIKNETHLTPDLPGRMAAGVGGLFDFVFVMESEVLGPDRIRRRLITAPVSKMVVRYRLPRALPPFIEMPTGPGGWKRILDAFNEALTGKKGAA